MFRPRLLGSAQRLLFTLASAIFIIAGTFIAIQFAKGYRPTAQGTLSGTGLVAASSNPKGALIYIDGESTNKVTDETINLAPGTYTIEFRKEGFTTWTKNLTVEPELVTQTGAELFRTVPSLSPLTFSGAVNLTPSPDGRKIAYSVASPSAQIKPGLYLLELTDRPTLFAKGPRLIADPPLGLDYQDANLLWSPDSSQLIANFPSANYLIDPDRLNRRSDLADISGQLPLLLQSWEQEVTNREKQLLLSLPDEMLKIATQSAKNIYFSPNGERMLYTAVQETDIPEELIPPLPASNNQPQSRHLEPGKLYIYDLKEDKNFLIHDNPLDIAATSTEKIKLVTDISESSLFNLATSTQSAALKLQDPESFVQTIQNFKAQYSSYHFTPYQWFPTGSHIMMNMNGSVNLVEYDSTNTITLYSGSYDQSFIYPWPDGTKLIILTNLTNNPDLPPNLYAINLK